MYNARLLPIYGSLKVRENGFMPIYEYSCQSCGHQLEALQRMSDQPLIDCPACQQPSLKKKVSAAGFRLSGSGWYETDFKGSKQKNIAAESKGTNPDSAAKSTESAKAATANKD